jgi:cell division transport system ATP-binding protein
MTEENVLIPADAEAAAETVSEQLRETPVGEELQTAVEDAQAVAGEVTAETAETVSDVTDAVTEEITEAAESVEELKDTTADEVAEAVEAAEETVEEASETVAEEITEVADAVEEAAAETVEENVKETAEEATEAAAEVAEDAGLSELISEAVPGVTDEELEALSEQAEKNYEKLSSDKGDGASGTGEGIDENPLERIIEPPVILFDHVHKEYEGQIEDSVALVNVSFQIQKGEFVFIVGPSGSGKSTMIRLMMREISPSGGNIYIAGKDLAKLRRRQVSKYRRNIGIVFQDFRLLPDRNVYDNVAFAQRVIGAPKREIPKEVSKVLHLVGLSQKYKSFPNELSGGEQQRVAIARALVNNPMIILADEPTGNLDPQNSYEIMSLLEEINRRGTTVVIVTHDREVVDQMQKRVVTLQDGVIIEDKKGGYIYG